jgi:hypothetical protein
MAHDWATANSPSRPLSVPILTSWATDGRGRMSKARITMEASAPGRAKLRLSRGLPASHPPATSPLKSVIRVDHEVHHAGDAMERLEPGIDEDDVTEQDNAGSPGSDGVSPSSLAQ